MSTPKFFARLFSGGSEWPVWRKIVRLALLSVMVALFCALATIEYDGWLLLADLAAMVIFIIAAVILAYSSVAYFLKWQRRQREQGRTTDPAMNKVGVVFFGIGVLLVIFLLGWGLDRAGVISLDYYHPERTGGLAGKRINPLICVNNTPSLGFAAPYPEVFNAPVTEIRSIGVCPHPLNDHLLKIEGLRVNGTEYRATDLNWIRFDPPMLLKPDEEIEVIVIGRDPYYGLPNSPLYVIKRSLPYSVEEIKGLLTRGDREPGYQRLDWERAGRVGLIYADHTFEPETHKVVDIFATYGDGELSDAWSTRFPGGREIVRIPFNFCLRAESDWILAGYMHSRTPAERKMVLTVEKDGTVLAPYHFWVP